MLHFYRLSEDFTISRLTRMSVPEVGLTFEPQPDGGEIVNPWTRESAAKDVESEAPRTTREDLDAAKGDVYDQLRAKLSSKSREIQEFAKKMNDAGYERGQNKWQDWNNEFVNLVAPEHDRDAKEYAVALQVIIFGQEAINDGRADGKIGPKTIAALLDYIKAPAIASDTASTQTAEAAVTSPTDSPAGVPSTPTDPFRFGTVARSPVVRRGGGDNPGGGSARAGVAEGVAGRGTPQQNEASEIIQIEPVVIVEGIYQETPEGFRTTVNDERPLTESQKVMYRNSFEQTKKRLIEAQKDYESFSEALRLIENDIETRRASLIGVEAELAEVNRDIALRKNAGLADSPDLTAKKLRAEERIRSIARDLAQHERQAQIYDRQSIPKAKEESEQAKIALDGLLVEMTHFGIA